MVNKEEHKRQVFILSLLFALLLVTFGVCAYVTLIIANKGIAYQTANIKRYDRIFKHQAELNYQLDDLLNKLGSLRHKKRTVGEHKQLQKMITERRIALENEIDAIEEVEGDYAIYRELLSQIEEIQSVLELYDIEQRKRAYYISQLERCKTIYKEKLKQRR
ncbi:type VI secretion system TssO [Capnocytophaga sputigena]|uniref:Uncharacterized protein n=1 Tax=Capnocytophaga sputigena TaxID=1019 RepID=A0AAX2IBS3_CAPSP|nr:type VI secretion system TssO [Capnocytophaga sputigena]ATA84354.1 hypothetical protein CGC55_07480 [Capnocytophaga sputigena]SQA75886.1 Uncharacterised protein [Capnocytophaga sputigena]